MAYVRVGFLKAIATGSRRPSYNLQATGGFCLEGYEKSKMNHWH